jgi:hypothetical protein
MDTEKKYLVLISTHTCFLQLGPDQDKTSPGQRYVFEEPRL